ncbi:MAG TPA: S8 family serine peptidase [Thermoanaerobaculia bacterium]|jgi:subtilisin family serine protease
MLVFAAAGNAIAGNYLVVFKAPHIPAGAAARIAAAGGTVIGSLDAVGVIAASGDASFAARMAGDASVQAIGPEQMYAKPADRVIEAAQPESGPTAADSLLFFQWDMRRIGAPALWSRLPLATNGVAPTVAVLDVGVADNHPDLSGQVIASVATSFCNSSGGPNNSAAYPKYATLIDFDAHPVWNPSDGCTPAAVTYEFHGTHVSGTIAAKFGGGRVVGLDPDTRIAAYKVFDRFRFTDADGVHDDVGAFDFPLFVAIVDAAQHGYGVISMSLGGVSSRNSRDGNASWLAWDRVTKYANRLGTVIVAAAGNNALNVNGTLYNIPSDLPTVMSVSATGWSNLSFMNGQYGPAPGSFDVLAFYSNFGAAVDIAAPGGDCGPQFPNNCEAQYLILSDSISSTGTLNYVFAAGTSMATPHVSAVAAVVRSLHPSWTPGEVRAFLKSTADPVGPRQWFGAGVVNADRATQ